MFDAVLSHFFAQNYLRIISAHNIPICRFISPLVWNRSICYAEAAKKISKHWLKHRCVCKGRLGIRMQKVIVVSKTHLDLGFTDYAEHIYKKYLDEFIPSAVAIANELNADGTKRFVWTTGSWLL